VRERDRGDAVKKLVVFSFSFAFAVTSTAWAGAREEAAAKAALTHAVAEHHAHHYGRALEVLSKAEKACEPDRCSPSTLAALLRDMGTMQLLDGDEDKARGNFSAALAFDSSIDLNPAYAANDVRAIWNELKSPGAAPAASQPSGDFDHTPAQEQKKDVPLPVYVEYHGSAHPASVVVRYAASGTNDYRRMQLARVGHGWGGVIPCGAVKLGTLHYYFQGLDADSLPILDSGDKRHPYSVPIKQALDGPKPHLPGHRAPTMCGEGLDDEEESRATNVENENPETPKAKPTGPATYSRIWLGISGSMDFTFVPAGTDVCARDASNNGAPVDPNWSCTSNTPEGTDFPSGKGENATLVPGNAGEVNNGLQPGNVRVKATFDFAITPNLLLGVAVGYVAGAYQGGVSPKFIPIHLEARATWIFGSEPLMKSGFNVYAQLAGGAAEYDANLTVRVGQNNVAGMRPVQAWHVGGPGFVALEGGLRYAFSPRAALSLGIRGTAAFGVSFFPAFGPDVSLQFGL
jgi:hypothetical protein